MKPVKFPNANTIIGGEIPANKNNGVILSRWKLSWSERFSVLFYGHIWLVVKGERQPPIALSGNQAFEITNP